MRETEDFYFFWYHQFGQWTLRDITDPDGITYNCCEQYMMYKKAALFSDHERAEAILNETEPSRQQQMGRKVHGFSSSIWDQHKYGIVWYGNYLKFTQHQDLRNRLINTEDKELVEASPHDLVWGVGYSADNDKILDKANWKGQNLLGKVLMSVRKSLRAI